MLKKIALLITDLHNSIHFITGLTHMHKSSVRFDKKIGGSVRVRQKFLVRSFPSYGIDYSLSNMLWYRLGYKLRYRSGLKLGNWLEYNRGYRLTVKYRLGYKLWYVCNCNKIGGIFKVKYAVLNPRREIPNMMIYIWHKNIYHCKTNTGTTIILNITKRSMGNFVNVRRLPYVYHTLHLQ